MSNLGFLTLGYGLIWVIIAAYVFFISRRQASLRRQLEVLQVEVDEAAEKLGRREQATAEAGAADSATSNSVVGAAGTEGVPAVASGE